MSNKAQRQECFMVLKTAEGGFQKWVRSKYEVRSTCTRTLWRKTQHFHTAVFWVSIWVSPGSTPIPRPPEPSDLFLLLMAGSQHTVPTLAHFFRITSSPFCLQVNSLVWVLHRGAESCSTSSGTEGAQQWPRGAGACLDVQKARAGRKLKPAELRASTNWSVYR